MTRMPTMLSSAVCVTSPTFCWASISTGFVRFVERTAIMARSGPMASAISVSGRSMRNRSTDTSTNVKMCWKMKISP